MRWLDSITGSMVMSWSKLREIVKDREIWCAAVHVVPKNQTRFSNWTKQWYIFFWGNSSPKHTHTFTCTGLVYSNPVTSIKGPTIVVQSSISHLEEACQVCSGYFSFLSLISHLKQMVISSGYPCLCVGKKPSKPMTLKRYFVYVCVCNLRLGRTSLSLFYLASPKIA